MQLGMIGAGRMGSNMCRRLLAFAHECVVHDRNAEAVVELVEAGAHSADSLEHLVEQLAAPRHVWLMLPVSITDRVLDDLVPLLQPGDCVIDGGNSYYHDDIRRAETLRSSGIDYLDVGVSGGVWGRERGYSLMIGGSEAAVQRLQPVFRTLAPGVGAAPRTPGREGEPSPAEEGYLHCGPAGAGHFVKMVHNGIEYGAMAALAEGLNILHGANVGKQSHDQDAETTPMRRPELYQFDFDVSQVAEVWRRGSVIGSWLLDLTAGALLQDPKLEHFNGRVSDSGEGRWTVQAAVDEGVPVPVISAALFARFSSRDENEFADRALSAMRHAFGGHLEKTGN